MEGTSIDCGHGGAARVSGGGGCREHRSQPGHPPPPPPASGLLLSCQKSARLAFGKSKLRWRAMGSGRPGRPRGSGEPGGAEPRCPRSCPRALPSPSRRQPGRRPAAKEEDARGPPPRHPAPRPARTSRPSAACSFHKPGGPGPGGPAGAPRLRPGAARRGLPRREGGGCAGAGPQGDGAGGGSEPRRVGGGAGLQPVFKFPSQELSSLEHARPGAARRVRAGAGPGERGVSRQPPQRCAPPAPP